MKPVTSIDGVRNPLHSSSTLYTGLSSEAGFADSTSVRLSSSLTDDGYMEVAGEPEDGEASPSTRPLMGAAAAPRLMLHSLENHHSADRRASEMLQSTLENAALDIPETQTYLSGIKLSANRFRAMMAKRLWYSARDRKAILSQVCKYVVCVVCVVCVCVCVCMYVCVCVCVWWFVLSHQCAFCDGAAAHTQHARLRLKVCLLIL